MKKQTNYLIYLLRVWRDGETAPWRASLESARTGNRRAFPSLQHLFAFLEAQTNQAVQKGQEEEKQSDT